MGAERDKARWLREAALATAAEGGGPGAGGDLLSPRAPTRCPLYHTHNTHLLLCVEELVFSNRRPSTTNHQPPCAPPPRPLSQHCCCRPRPRVPLPRAWTKRCRARTRSRRRARLVSVGGSRLDTARQRLKFVTCGERARAGGAWGERGISKAVSRLCRDHHHHPCCSPHARARTDAQGLLPGGYRMRDGGHLLPRGYPTPH
jgi:hypothetical protein